MGKLSVVGNQHKAGGVLVQPARREKSLAPQVLRHQVHDSGLIFVLACADYPFGFIEHQIQVHPQAERLALHLHCVAVKVHSKIRRLYHLSVDSDRSLSDERFDLAAGKVALHRDCFIQPLFFCHCISPYSVCDGLFVYCGSTLLYHKMVSQGKPFKKQKRQKKGGLFRFLWRLASVVLDCCLARNISHSVEDQSWTVWEQLDCFSGGYAG